MVGDQPRRVPTGMLFAFVPVAGHHLLAWIIIGVIAGALAGRVMRGTGFGLLGDIIVGLAGAVVGGVLLHALTRRGHVAPSILLETVVAFGGAVVLLMLVRLVGGGRRMGRHHLL
jgi:uncharacterized membrane protein YeaQ/YmgE (transglycosylase-associated protein family)